MQGSSYQGFELLGFKCVNLSVFKGVLQGTHPQVQEHLREDVLKQMFLLHNDQKDTSECCAVTSHIIIFLLLLGKYFSRQICSIYAKRND